jgi:sarcosine oxidase subunit beta
VTIRYLDGPPPTADLVIVGGGVVGAATAFHAKRAGIHPLIVEARPRLSTLTTPVAAGAFRLQFDDREELDLVRESAETFLNFEEVTRQSEYPLRVEQRGYLWLTTSQETAASQRALVGRLHAWGQTDVELLDGDRTRERFPWVSPDVVGSRFRAGDGFLDTKQLTFGLASGASADAVTSCAVTGFDLEGDRLVAVRTARGTISCGAAVICAGPLSGPVAAGAGLQLPLVTVNRQKLIVPDLAEVPANGPMVVDEDTGAHWRPALRGAWLLFTDPDTPPSEPTFDVALDHRFAFRLLDPSSPVAAARVVPFWRDVWERGADHWLLQAGQYTITPDYRPVIGPTAVEGLLINTGYSGHGIMLSVAGARILTQELVGGAGDGPFRPDRVFEPIPQPTL